MGVEIKESPVSDAEFDAMQAFVHDYLAASVENEEEGGRMRWYPWHSAEYRFNHILNVVDIATEIARKEGANVDVTRVAALFHDIAKLEVEQDVHAEAGARIAREYLSAHGDYPESFVDQVCRAIEDHSYQGDLSNLPLETQCLIEADILDKVGANGAALMLLRMGYESRTHMDAAEMVDRVIERGEDAEERVRSDTAESIAHQRLKRARWFQEWLEAEVTEMNTEESLDDVATGMGDS
ncbi:HD domain-containing protein [Haloarcula nitratireducens]|uniref:HD domain-containing protein n=1 Tax=Haloarcula nitratireducens TaxID=2487749 RepID=A0AAW4P6W3_9EURY|nr:HD domain-containing protein [Halomicroarcula nitratireducens]MBX0293493.1 HD domain-containing protein [Halomicroarcula nitratireducens]